MGVRHFTEVVVGMEFKYTIRENQDPYQDNSWTIAKSVSSGKSLAIADRDMEFCACKVILSNFWDLSN